MHKAYNFDQKDNNFFLLTYLPYFFADRYRKQTIYFLGLIDITLLPLSNTLCIQENEINKIMRLKPMKVNMQTLH